LGRHFLYRQQAKGLDKLGTGEESIMNEVCLKYLNEVAHGDIWLTNCRSDDIFEYVVRFQAKWPDNDVWADVPKDQSSKAIPFYDSYGKIPLNFVSNGATQQSLMAWDYYGIYRRPSKPL
jgi:hypothetical protein